MLGRGDAKFFKVEGVSAAVPSLEQGSTHGGRASRPAHCLFLSLHFRVARECLHYKGILSSYGRNQSTLKAQKYALLGLGREVCWPWAGAKPAPSAPILPASAAPRDLVQEPPGHSAVIFSNILPTFVAHPCFPLS